MAFASYLCFRVIVFEGICWVFEMLIGCTWPMFVLLWLLVRDIPCL